MSVQDNGGDGRHVRRGALVVALRPLSRFSSIDVVAAAFEGKSSVDRQRMVYKAIWTELQARCRRRAACGAY